MRKIKREVGIFASACYTQMQFSFVVQQYMFLFNKASKDDIRIYRRHRLASEGIVTLGVTQSRCVCVRRAAYISLSTARRVNLGGEGNALYPVLSSLSFH